MATCDDVLSLQDMKDSKKDVTFNAEWTSGKSNGDVDGADIDSAVNPRTGDSVKTIPAIAKEAFENAGVNIVGDFSDAVKVALVNNNDAYTSRDVIGYEVSVWRTNQPLPYTPTGNSPVTGTEASRWLLVDATNAANTANIADNTADIADNTANIASNTANIATNTTKVTALEENQQSGVIVFQTYALLGAYTPSVNEQKGSFKVSNDSDSSLNGYYSWVSGTTYIKDTSLVVNAIDRENTSDAVSGKAVDVADRWAEATANIGVHENLVENSRLDPSIPVTWFRPVSEYLAQSTGIIKSVYNCNESVLLAAGETLGGGNDLYYIQELGEQSGNYFVCSFVITTTLANNFGNNGAKFITRNGVREAAPLSTVIDYIELSPTARRYYMYGQFPVDAGSTFGVYIGTGLGVQAYDQTISYFTATTSPAPFKHFGIGDIVDKTARGGLAANASEIEKISSIIAGSNLYRAEGLPNTTNTNLLQIDFVFELNANYSEGDVHKLTLNYENKNSNVNLVSTRRFYTDSPTSYTGGISVNASTLSVYNGGTQYMEELKAIPSGASSKLYVHYFIESSYTDTDLTSVLDYYNPTVIGSDGKQYKPVNYFIFDANQEDSLAYSEYIGDEVISKEYADATYASKVNKELSVNYLYNKKVVTIGDSMVKGHTLQSNAVWDYLLTQRNGMELVNYGINGTELGFNNGFGLSVLNRYSAMDNDADYVIVFAGTNDAKNNQPIGVQTDSFEGGQETFYGALNDLCTGLITKYPTKKILFITPYLRLPNYQGYVDVINEGCASKGIIVFDNIVAGGVDFTNAAQSTALTFQDNTHLNEAGMDYVSYKYEQALRRL